MSPQIAPPISRYPRVYQSALADLVAKSNAAADMIQNNPPLAVCLAAASWDTHCENRPSLGHLVAWRRRKICEALGFPGTESVVRILAKVPPEACNIGLLMRLRSLLDDPCLRKILSHIKRIGEAELRMAAFWQNCPHMSLPLFLELAAESTSDSLRLLRDTERMIQNCRCQYPPFRSMAEVKQCHDRLVREQNQREVAQVVFPPAPLKGTSTIQPLLTVEELLEEARSQNHCASMYSGSVGNGNLYFYRVLEPERATISISRRRGGRWHLEEIAGRGNAKVSDATRVAVENWLLRQGKGTAPK